MLEPLLARHHPTAVGMGWENSSFIQQIFMKPLLCARPWMRHRGSGETLPSHVYGSPEEVTGVCVSHAPHPASQAPEDWPHPRKLKAPCGQELFLPHRTGISPGHGCDIPARRGLPRSIEPAPPKSRFLLSFLEPPQ